MEDQNQYLRDNEEIRDPVIRERCRRLHQQLSSLYDANVLDRASVKRSEVAIGSAAKLLSDYGDSVFLQPKYAHQFGKATLVKINVGGKVFEVPKANLMSSPYSLFSHLFNSKEEEGGAAVAAIDDYCEDTKSASSCYTRQCDGTKRSREWNGAAMSDDSAPQRIQHEEQAFILRDKDGNVFFDRDPHVFELLLSVMRPGVRGHRMISPEEAEMILHDAAFFQLSDLKLNEAFLVARGGSVQRFFPYHAGRGAKPAVDQLSAPGPNISTQRTRFRSVYSVCPVGSTPFTAGIHSCTFKIKSCEYVGIGLISDDCTIFDSEFHKCMNCCVYYMTGVIYSNFPVHEKHETNAKFTSGSVVKVTVNMDNKMIAFTVNGFITKCIVCPSASRLRFAVAMKNASVVSIDQGSMSRAVFYERTFDELSRGAYRPQIEISRREDGRIGLSSPPSQDDEDEEDGGDCGRESDCSMLSCTSATTMEK